MIGMEKDRSRKNSRCEKCGAEMMVERCGCAVTYICPKCGWSVATTEWEPIDLDETEYVFRLAEGNAADKETLSLVSKMTGKNFIASKKAIEELDVIYKGKARDAVEMKNKLNANGIHFTIEPDLPY